MYSDYSLWPNFFIQIHCIVALLNKFKKRRQNRGFVHLLNGFNERTCEIFFGTKNILLCLTRGALMVRIGGGFMPLGSFCKQFASREQARVDHERLKRRNSVPGTPSGMRRSSERVSAIAKSTPRLDSPRSWLSNDFLSWVWVSDSTSASGYIICMAVVVEYVMSNE